MSRFDEFRPASLSPRPVRLRPCELPYGLTWDALGLPHGECFLSHDKGGPDIAVGRGPNSCIVTLRVPGDADRTVFVKSQELRHRFEAPRYRFLASRGVPTPAVLAAVEEPDREVIVLEFLPTIGIDFSSVDEMDELLRLVARWNAIDDGPDFFGGSVGYPRAEFLSMMRERLAEISSDAGLDVEEWIAAYIRICEQEGEFPRALTHGEFFVQQVGRKASGELVVFDLESMGMPRARFGDLSTVLGLAGESGRTERELLSVYLEAHDGFGGPETTVDEAEREIAFVRAGGFFSTLATGFMRTVAGSLEAVVREAMEQRPRLVSLGVL